MKLLDSALSPPPDYANSTYENQLITLWKRCFRPKGSKLRKIAHFLRLAFMMGASYLLLPAAYALKKSGYRFSTIDLAQIGSVIYLDLFLREDIIYRKTPKHKILQLASKYKDANRYILDLYNDHITFVRNPLAKLLFSPFFLSPIFREDSSFKYDLTIFTEVMAHNIWNKYQEEHPGPLIKFPEKDIATAKYLLKEHLPENQKFIALHVRDNGFYQIPSQASRNADINTYLPAIKYLNEQGYAVIRIGDHNMTEIKNMTKECGNLLFDYAHSNIRSEMMDAYILSHCEFYIGLASGPASMPMCFGKNSINVNWLNAFNSPNFMEKDLTTFKKYRYKKDNSLIPFETLLREPFDHGLPKDIMERENIYLEDNSDQEILNTIKEYLNNPQATPTTLQKQAQKKILKSNFAYGAKGHFSDTILSVYKNEGKF